MFDLQEKIDIFDDEMKSSEKTSLRDGINIFFSNVLLFALVTCSVERKLKIFMIQLGNWSDEERYCPLETWRHLVNVNLLENEDKNVNLSKQKCYEPWSKKEKNSKKATKCKLGESFRCLLFLNIFSSCFYKKSETKTQN